MQDPYATLGVPRTATDDEIKKAYRKLAAKYHPDLNPNDKIAEQKMQEINSAYELIKDIRSGKRTEASTYGNTQQSYGQGVNYGGYWYGGNYGQNGYGRTYTQSTQQNQYEEDFEDVWQSYTRNVRVIRFPFFRILLGIMALRFLSRLLLMLFFGF